MRQGLPSLSGRPPEISTAEKCAETLPHPIPSPNKLSIAERVARCNSVTHQAAAVPALIFNDEADAATPDTLAARTSGRQNAPPGRDRGSDPLRNRRRRSSRSCRVWSAPPQSSLGALAWRRRGRERSTPIHSGISHETFVCATSHASAPIQAPVRIVMCPQRTPSSVSRRSSP